MPAHTLSLPEAMIKGTTPIPDGIVAPLYGDGTEMADRWRMVGLGQLDWIATLVIRAMEAVLRALADEGPADDAGDLDRRSGHRG